MAQSSHACKAATYCTSTRIPQRHPAHLTRNQEHVPPAYYGITGAVTQAATHAAATPSSRWLHAMHAAASPQPPPRACPAR